MDEFNEILNLVLESEVFRIMKLSFWIVFIVVWLGGISFVVKDAKKRYKKLLFQNLTILIPVLFHLPGLLIYFLIRPAKTNVEKIYEQEFEKFEDVFSCPKCKTEAKENFIFCPKCGSEIFKHCENCGKMIKKDWKYCPYCRQKN